MNLKAKSLIVRNGLTGAGLAREIGVSETWFSLVLNGHRKSERVRKAIARALGVTVSELWPENGKRAA